MTPTRRALSGALAVLTLSIASPTARTDPPGQPRELADRALAELHAGRLSDAAALLERAIATLDGAPPNALHAELLLKLAHVEVNRGRYRAGLDLGDRALAVYETLGDPAGHAAASLQIGAAHDELAEYDASHRYYDRAIVGFRALGDRLNEARTLSALGTSYRFLGNPGDAAALYAQAIELYRETGNESFVGWEHRNLGMALEDLGDPGRAEEHYRSALALLPADQAWPRSMVLFNLGRLAAHGGSADASRLLEEGLSMARSSQNRWAVARIQVELARLQGRLGQPVSGLALATEGARLLAEMGAQDLEWEARFVRARLLEQSGSLGDARREYLEALSILQRVRSSIGTPLLRTRYTPRVRPVYDALLALEVRAADAAERSATALGTFQIAELYRARTFAEMLLESRHAPVPAPSPLGEEERTLRGKINALHTKLTRLPHTVADREGLERELVEAERRHAAVQSELRAGDPRFSAPDPPVPMDPQAAGSLLEARGDLLAFHLGEHASLIWHLGRGGLELHALPPRAEIERLVLFHHSLIRHRSDPPALRRLSRRLYDLLIGPVADRLEAERGLVVIPDGALFYLPFEALLAPPTRADATGRYLVQDHDVSYVPSLAVLEELARIPPERQGPPVRDLLAFGNPLPAEGGAYPPLVHAESETRRVGALFRRGRSERRTGAEATESSFRRLVERPSRVVHLATHGILDGRHPQRSGLVFGPETEDTGRGDGFLNLHEIFGLRMAADLVVLSACDTARGELLHGEGILGLTRGFLLAGSRAVIASQWKVDDRSTEDLMVGFYAELSRGRTAAEALRQAKLAFIRRAPAGGPDPFPWAGFVLVGDGEIRVPLRAVPRWVAWSLLSAGLLLFAVGTLGAKRARASRRTREPTLQSRRRA